MARRSYWINGCPPPLPPSITRAHGSAVRCTKLCGQDSNGAGHGLDEVVNTGTSLDVINGFVKVGGGTCLGVCAVFFKAGVGGGDELRTRFAFFALRTDGEALAVVYTVLG